MCLNPQWISPYRLPDGSVSFKYTGEVSESSVIDFDTGEVQEPFQVGCGRCVECMDLHRLSWVHRLLDEQKCHKQCCFLTLTYRPDSGFDNDLHPEHVTLFLKRFRKRIAPIRIRYFLCGEYGSRFKRPHYHVVVFGYSFPDLRPFRKDRSGFMMSRSAMLESLWPYGFSSVLPVCDQTLSYVTKDMQKLLPVPKPLHEPFVRMSNRPGIGANGWNRSVSDGRLWHNGKSVTLPRYYRKLCDREGIDIRELRKKDILYAESRSDDDLQLRSDRALRRLKCIGFFDSLARERKTCKIVEVKEEKR